MTKNIGMIFLGGAVIALCFLFVPGLNKQVVRAQLNYVCGHGTIEKCNQLSRRFQKAGDEKYFIEGQQKACFRDQAKNCRFVGAKFEKLHNFENALAFYQRACELKSEESCGDALLVQMALNKWDDALKFAKASCLGGMSALCRGWGLIGRERNLPKEAHAGFYYGCYTHKDYESCFQLGQVFFRAHQMSYAYQTLMMACSQQHEQACKTVEFLRMAQARTPSAANKN